MGLDVSSSVDTREYRLQIDGIAAALNSPSVRAILFDGVAAPVYILVYEWSGPSDQKIVLPWTGLTDAFALEVALEQLRQFDRKVVSETTAIGSAMTFGMSVLQGMSHCWKLTLDLSGDGQSNAGPPPNSITVPANITINGLVVGAGDRRGDDERFEDIKELSSYYRTQVVKGADAFVETALGFEDYANAMERKLIRELASLVIGLGPAPGTLPQ